MRKLLSYILLAVLLCVFHPAVAQDRRIDSALDRYEQICDRCIQLRDRSLRGEQIAPEELRSLLEQVSSLRETLQVGEVNMSSAQRQRFEKIRNRYTAAFQPSAGSSRTIVTRAVSDLPTLAWRPSVKVTSTLGSGQAGQILRSTQDTEREQGMTRVNLQKRETSKDIVNVSVMALAGWRPETMSYGAMVSLTSGRFGAYLKGHSNFLSNIADYSCLSNGTSGGGVIWTTGNESHPAWAVGAGGIIHIAGPLSIYAGSGYGCSQILWEDADGKWARVDDISEKGVCADTGIILSAGMFAALVGVNTIKMKKPTIEVGVGVRF